MRRKKLFECFSSRQQVGRKRKGNNFVVSIFNAIAKCNQFMGGVDLSDWHTEKLRISIAGKKWYFKTFTYLFDVIVVNAWVLFKMATQEKISALEFLTCHCYRPTCLGVIFCSKKTQVGL